MSEHAHVLATYTRLRPIRMKLNNTLVGTLGKQAIEESGRTLGLLKRGILVFNSESETSVLMDYAIYNYRSGGRNAVERYLKESPPPPGSVDRAVLEAMLNAYYSLFQVVGSVPGVGVTVHDVLRGDTSFLADFSFSKTVPKGVIMATRVIPWDDFVMTSGATLPLNSAAGTRIKKEIERTFHHETDFHQLTPAQDADLAALIIRSCLAAGTSSNIAYAMPGEQPSRTSVMGGVQSQRSLVGGEPQRPRANRNDPCPCGSGRKYKTCCGRR